jgi:hypothetical protein
MIHSGLSIKVSNFAGFSEIVANFLWDN